MPSRNLTIFLLSIFLVVLTFSAMNFGSTNVFQANDNPGDSTSSSSNSQSSSSGSNFDPALPPQLQPVPTSPENQDLNRNPFAPNFQDQQSSGDSNQNPNSPGASANPDLGSGNDFDQDNQPCWVTATIEVIGKTNVLVVETNAASREGFIWAVASGFSPELYFGFEQTGRQSVYTRSIFQSVPNDPRVTLYSSEKLESSSALCKSF
jgi:hypothetical protein